MDYVFNFLLHLPNFAAAPRKNMEPTRGVAIKIFARYVAAARHILRVKQGKRVQKLEWTGGCYTGGHLLADSRHRQWKWRLPQIHVQYKWKHKYNISGYTNGGHNYVYNVNTNIVVHIGCQFIEG